MLFGTEIGHWIHFLLCICQVVLDQILLAFWWIIGRRGILLEGFCHIRMDRRGERHWLMFVGDWWIAMSIWEDIRRFGGVIVWVRLDLLWRRSWWWWLWLWWVGNGLGRLGSVLFRRIGCCWGWVGLWGGLLGIGNVLGSLIYSFRLEGRLDVDLDWTIVCRIG